MKWRNGGHSRHVISPHGAAAEAHPSTVLFGAHVLPRLLYHLLHQLKQHIKPWYDSVSCLACYRHYSIELGLKS
jgi:hypothetical protein